MVRFCSLSIILCILLLPHSIAAGIFDAILTIEGSSTILPVIRDAAEIFSDKTGTYMQVKGGGTTEGITSTMFGRADIGMVSRSLSDNETPILQKHLIGHDGISIIVNNAVPVRNLTRQQTVEIFNGTTTNWNQFGADSRKITVVAKQRGRSTRMLFDNFFGLKRLRYEALRIGSNTEAIIMVASEPGAIGYVSIASAQEAISLGVEISILPIDGIKANMENVENGLFPLSRELNLITRKDDISDTAMSFIKFVQSDTGQELLKKHRYIPISSGSKKETTP